MTAQDLFNRAGLAFIVFAIAFAGFYAASGKPDHGPLFFVAFGATAGWLYTSHVARRNQLEKNTYDLIQSYVKDARFVELRDAALRGVGHYKPIDRAHAERLVGELFAADAFTVGATEPFPAAHYLTQIANFYEYLAIGLGNDFLAEAPAKRYFASTLRTFYEVKMQHIIAVLREGAAKPGGAVRRPPYDDMLALLQRWHPDLTILKP